MLTGVLSLAFVAVATGGLSDSLNNGFSNAAAGFGSNSSLSLFQQESPEMKGGGVDTTMTPGATIDPNSGCEVDNTGSCKQKLGSNLGPTSDGVGDGSGVGG